MVMNMVVQVSIVVNVCDNKDKIENQTNLLVCPTCKSICPTRNANACIQSVSCSGGRFVQQFDANGCETGKFLYY